MKLNRINTGTILPFIHGNQDRIWFKKIVLNPSPAEPRYVLPLQTV